MFKLSPVFLILALLASGAAMRPAQADSDNGTQIHKADASSFRDNFERVLGENYPFMERQLNQLGNDGVIDLGNYSHLSLDQRIAILSYTYSTFEPVNSRLRSGGPAATEIAPYVSTLNSALDLLDRYEGVVLRTADALPPAVLAQHQVGQVVKYAAYTSTSKRRYLTAAYNFTIRSHTGADLDGYASNINEREVLFKPGTRFFITSRSVKAGRVFIEMEELSGSQPQLKSYR